MAIWERLQKVEDTGSNMRALLESVIWDKRLNAEDSESISRLAEIFEQDVDANYGNTRKEITDMFAQTLRTGFDVANQQDMETFQKILLFSGLSFDMQKIMEINRDFLTTTVPWYTYIGPGAIIDNGQESITTEQKTFTFKLKTNGDLEVYDHSNPDQWGNFRWNDIIGIVVAGSNIIQDVSGRGDRLEDNNSISKNTT
jgi:hypothetical protein